MFLAGVLAFHTEDTQTRPASHPDGTRTLHPTADYESHRDSGVGRAGADIFDRGERGGHTAPV
jgi:hypothetical protein